MIAVGPEARRGEYMDTLSVVSTSRFAAYEC